MARLTRGLRYALVGAALVAAVVVAALWVLTRTDFGVERAGQFALDQLRGAINGELAVGRIRSDGLLRGVTLHDVRIDDPDGRPFLRADSARLAYRLRTLLGGDIAFDRLILHSPEVYIERLPGRDEWNYDILFRGDTTPKPDTVETRDLVLIEDITIRDGFAVVRMPWVPDGPVAPEDTARLILEEVPGGLARVVRFEAINGRIPRVVWENPDEEGKLIRIRELAARAYIWDTPADLQRVEGTLTIRDSLVAFDAPVVRLPSSEVAAVGTIILEDPRLYDVEVEGEDLAFEDFQWLYPRLPADGGGSLRFRIQSQGDGRSILWLAQDAHVRTSGSEVRGSFGMITGDTTYFSNVDLQASPLDLELLRSVLPMDLPLEGLLIGTVEIEGPVSALDTRGDVLYRPRGADRASAVRWDGVVAGRPPYAARGLRADVRGLELGQLARWAPDLKVRGVATGRIEADGSLERGLRVRGTVGLERDGLVSTVRGDGELAVGRGGSRFDLRFDAVPLALEVLGEQFPALASMVGAAEGPITVTGSLSDLRVDADLRTPAGAVALDGRFALDTPVPRYRAEGSVTDFRLDRVLDAIPDTRVTGRFELDAAGRGLEGLEGGVALDIAGASVAGVDVHRGAFRGAVGGGVLTVDSFAVATAVGDASATGRIGLVEGRHGELAVRVRADSLGFLEPLVFPATPTEELALESEPRLGGTLTAAGVVAGNVHQWTARGTVEGGDLLYDDLAVRRGHADLAWTPDRVTVDATVDSLRANTRLVAHAAASVQLAGRSGSAVVRAAGRGPQEVELGGAFTLEEGATTFRLDDLALATRDGRWALRDTLSGRIARDGVRVDELVLVRAPEFARVRVTGTLPWHDDEPRAGASVPADLLLELDSVPVGELLRVAQADSTIDGTVTGRFRLGGTAMTPLLDGRLAARDFRYGGAVLDSAGGELSYREGLMTGRFSGWREGESIIRGVVGALPIDLALTPREDRLLDRPVEVRVAADSVPAGLLAFLAPGFADVTGVVHGDLAVVGTAVAPELRGELRLTDGSALFEALNVRYRQVDVVARMGEGSRVELEGRIASRNGSAEVRGTLDLQRPSDPTFDVDVVARGFDASRRRDVIAVTDGQVHLGGRYTRPVVRGDLRLVSGELNIDEIWRQYQIVQLDPSLFELFDTATVDYRPPPENPFLANVRLEGLNVAAERDVWVRSRELNVEVVGSLEVELDRQVEELRMVGSLQARRGSYDIEVARATGVPARRFEIRQGTIDFVGTPGIDPNLEISASYRVHRSQGEPIDVLALVSGTLQNPRVTLSSDSDLPLTESDLASYILFGRAGPELSQTESDVLFGLVRPALTGFASTQLQRAVSGVFANFGLSVDYIALRTPQYGFGEYQDLGFGGMFSDAQLEVGMDVMRDVFVVGSYRIQTGGPATPTESALDQFGLRVEYRFRPTWTGEFYLEDRFARTPSFGLAEIDNRKVMGLSVFREWGY